MYYSHNLHQYSKRKCTVYIFTFYLSIPLSFSPFASPSLCLSPTSLIISLHFLLPPYSLTSRWPSLLLPSFSTRSVPFTFTFSHSLLLPLFSLTSIALTTYYSLSLLSSPLSNSHSPFFLSFFPSYPFSLTFSFLFSLTGRRPPPPIYVSLSLSFPHSIPLFFSLLFSCLVPCVLSFFPLSFSPVGGSLSLLSRSLPLWLPLSVQLQSESCPALDRTLTARLSSAQICCPWDICSSLDFYNISVCHWRRLLLLNNSTVSSLLFAWFITTSVTHGGCPCVCERCHPLRGNHPEVQVWNH